MEAKRTGASDRMIRTTADCVWSTRVFSTAGICKDTRLFRNVQFISYLLSRESAKSTLRVSLIH